MDYGYEKFKKDILSYTGIDLDCYKEEQMKRRINSFILRKSYKGYDDYFDHIRNDVKVCDEFLSYMTINVSEFYRNPEQWTVLENELLPDLLKKKGGKLKIWSAACSTGDEPYSMVMLLLKYLPIEFIEVLATDIDKQIIEKAKNGLYSENSLKNLPKEFIERYFTKIGSNSYKISDDIKRCVTFKQHNLLGDDYFKNMDLILCRNVLIYFTEQAKNQIYKKFYDALSPNSLLFIGSTEQIITYRDIGYDIYKSFFYKKN